MTAPPIPRRRHRPATLLEAEQYRGLEQRNENQRAINTFQIRGYLPDGGGGYGTMSADVVHVARDGNCNARYIYYRIQPRNVIMTTKKIGPKVGVT